MKYTFIQEDDSTGTLVASPDVTIKHQINGDVTITELVEHFERFMKASGFVFDGYLDIVVDKEGTYTKDTPEYEIGWYNTQDESGITRLGVSEK